MEAGKDAGFEGSLTGARYILTAICCFSKWCWLVPIPDKKATTVGKALLEIVLLSLAMFPSVLRSDNDPTFMSDAMNRILNIRHVFGSTYHPQSQGQVENMHHTMTSTCRKLLQDFPEEWEEVIPHCECILRITPLKSLGGRSPYQVVTGLLPRLSRVLLANGPLGIASASEYVERLLRYLKSCCDDIYRRQQEVREDEEAAGRFPGSISAELRVGDLVIWNFRRRPRELDRIDLSQDVAKGFGGFGRRFRRERFGWRMH